MRYYSIHHRPGEHLTLWQRRLLQQDWNRAVREERHPTIRGFARTHGLAPETWRRELKRGAVGVPVPDLKHPGRKIHPEYDAGKAQDSISEGRANKGCAMRVTNVLDRRFTQLVKEERRSPYDACCIMREENPDADIPCVRTWYNHIAHGDIGVKYGETPYHPDRKRRKHPAPHMAKTVPGHLTLEDRPREANERSEPGHLEIDTIVSCIGGRGGLLALIDRHTRLYILEPLNAITQDEVCKALSKLEKRGAFPHGIKSVTADNGCEFLDADAIKKILGCDVYYTRAYASWEKGSVENCNRIVRRWYPKGTDFSRCPRGDIRALETVINSIHRRSLGGMSATEFSNTFITAA